MTASKVRIGLYGTNGHQIHHALVDNRYGELVAVAAFDPGSLPDKLRSRDSSIRCFSTLAELLQDERVELVSLCSPRRRDQARDAIQCMKAGKSVYAEKPCAMSEEDLNRVIAVARQTGREFHEMAGTAFEQPYLAMRKQVLAGRIGTVVQVLAQKSYPYHDGRPQDESVDGGLLLQVGVHALRMIEHVTGVRVTSIQALDTQKGNPRRGKLRMAVAMLMRLENGGVATAIANYLNPRSFGQWGNETLRVFGTRGFVEAVDGGTRTRLVLAGRDCGPLNLNEPSLSFLDAYLKSLRGKARMPLSLEDEIHPTRMLLRARKELIRGGR